MHEIAEHHADAAVVAMVGLGYTLRSREQSGLSEAIYLTFDGPRVLASKRGRTTFFARFGHHANPFDDALSVAPNTLRVRIAGHKAGAGGHAAPHVQLSVHRNQAGEVAALVTYVTAMREIAATYPHGAAS